MVRGECKGELGGFKVRVEFWLELCLKERIVGRNWKGEVGG